MTLEREMILERRRAGQRLFRWRLLAALLGLLLLLALAVGGGSGDSIRKDHIARVDISGMILDDRKQQKLLADLRKSKRVKAVILRINSPGGTTTGGEALYNEIRALSKEKPVVAVFGTVAASAAYMIGIAADHIVTRGSSVTGSVGVIAQWPDMSGLMERVGVNMEEVKSGRLKAVPSPFRRAGKEELAPMKEMIEDSFHWFVGLVTERRGIKADAVPGLRQGRVYTGRQAVKYGLADEIGGETEALSWLRKKKKLDKDLPVLDRKPEKEPLLDSLVATARAAARQLGLGWLFPVPLLPPAGLLSMERTAGQNGLLSLWQTPDGGMGR